MTPASAWKIAPIHSRRIDQIRRAHVPAVPARAHVHTTSRASPMSSGLPGSLDRIHLLRRAESDDRVIQCFRSVFVSQSGYKRQGTSFLNDPATG
jgi:hypothetical protein